VRVWENSLFVAYRLAGVLPMVNFAVVSFAAMLVHRKALVPAAVVLGLSAVTSLLSIGGIFKLCDASKEDRGGFYFGEYREAESWGLELYLPLGLFMVCILLGKVRVLCTLGKGCTAQMRGMLAKAKLTQVAPKTSPKKGRFMQMGSGGKPKSKPKGSVLSGKL